VGLEDSLRPGLALVRVHLHHLSNHCCKALRAALVEELRAYYQPVKEERGMVPWGDLDEKGVKDRRLEIAKARRKRWKQRERNADLWRAVQYKPNAT